MEMSCYLHVLAALTPRKKRSNQQIGECVGTTACVEVWGKKSLAPTVIRAPDRPSRSLQLY